VRGAIFEIDPVDVSLTMKRSQWLISSANIVLFFVSSLL